MPSSKQPGSTTRTSRRPAATSKSALHGEVDDLWVDAWEEFVAAFAKHCELDKLNSGARHRMRAAFGASIGDALKKGKVDWRKQGKYTDYADFVVNGCACDLGHRLHKTTGKVTLAQLKVDALDLAEKWKKDCPESRKMLSSACDVLLDFFNPKANSGRPI